MRKSVIMNETLYKRLLEDLSSGSINDDVPVINVASETTSDVAANGEEAAKQAKANGARMAKIKVTPKTATAGGNVEVAGQGNTVRDQFTDAVQSTVKSGMNQRNTSYVVTVGPDGKPVQNEAKTYTKKQLEEGRMKHLYENGIKTTKAKINESVNTNIEYQVFNEKIQKAQEDLRQYQISIYQANSALYAAVNNIKHILDAYGVKYEIGELKFDGNYRDEEHFEMRLSTSFNLESEDELYNELMRESGHIDNEEMVYVSIWEHAIDFEVTIPALGTVE